MFGEILAIFLSSIVELALTAWLGLSTPESNPTHTAVSIWFLVILVIIIPVLFVWIFLKSMKDIEDETF
jgi:hypothetical protein